MKYIDEYRDVGLVRDCARAIAAAVTRPWTLMEVCGGQTHAIVRYGLDQLLPKELTLVHGPGCPVCVTPQAVVDRAIAIAGTPGVILCSFGDMLRVPGRRGDLLAAKAEGADVRVMYSPLDALELARRHRERQVVLFAVGFETTAPAHALAVHLARREGLTNFSALVSLVLVPPAMEAVLEAPARRVQGFLAAGHVCAVMGVRAYEDLARRHRVPIVVTGFEPLDILQGVHMCVRQLEAGRAEVENQYARAVKSEGTVQAQALMAEVFGTIAREWRGIGEIPASGLGLRSAYAEFDAARRFPAVVQADLDAAAAVEPEPTRCRSGQVLQGLLKPSECPEFGRACTPDNPLGATMVSGEGACAAYYRYRRGVGAP
ncbi:hydrogenase formation protein HypD [Haliangium sp.]|uniref:hydrogenase formation protein HypD n=1 Tax=Haliangium sp. TaxID=2663208 RepID=UPI003D0D5B98